MKYKENISTRTINYGFCHYLDVLVDFAGEARMIGGTYCKLYPLWMRCFPVSVLNGGCPIVVLLP